MDPLNFLPRITIPVLNVLFEGGHFLPRPLWVAESTPWLDERFGPVGRASAR